MAPRRAANVSVSPASQAAAAALHASSAGKSWVPGAGAPPSAPNSSARGFVPPSVTIPKTVQSRKDAPIVSPQLETPLMLPNLQVEPSPTTGAHHFMGPRTTRAQVAALQAAQAAVGFGPGMRKRQHLISRDSPVRRSPLGMEPTPTLAAVPLGGRVVGLGGAGGAGGGAGGGHKAERSHKAKGGGHSGEARKSSGGSSDEPAAKKKKSAPAADTALKMPLEYKVMVTTPDIRMEDGLRWRKYGQKIVKGSPFPRSYFKCTTANKLIQKHVEQCSTEPELYCITYLAEAGEAADLYAKLRNGPSVHKIERQDPQ